MAIVGLCIDNIVKLILYDYHSILTVILSSLKKFKLNYGCNKILLSRRILYRRSKT